VVGVDSALTAEIDGAEEVVPDVEPDEPEVEPDEPDVEPVEPEVEPVEPEVEPDEPEVEPEPDVESAVADVGTTTVLPQVVMWLKHCAIV
jgi:hypothetical protein